MPKKTFKQSVKSAESPANAFISKPEENAAVTNAEDSEPKETKTKRVNLLFRPSTKKNIEKLAFVNHTSLNDLISTVMEEYVAAHAADIERYNSFFGEENKV